MVQALASLFPLFVPSEVMLSRYWSSDFDAVFGKVLIFDSIFNSSKEGGGGGVLPVGDRAEVPRKFRSR